MALPHGVYRGWFLCVICKSSDLSHADCQREKVVNLTDWLICKDDTALRNRQLQLLSNFVLRLTCSKCGGKLKVVDLMDTQMPRPSGYKVPVARYRVRLRGEGRSCLPERFYIGMGEEPSVESPMAEKALPPKSWTTELPVKLKCAISDCITVSSRIESLVVEILWEMEEATLERKKEISKQWSSQNFKRIKQAIKLIPGAKTDAIWPALKSIFEERNLIAHGVWMFTDDARPLVVWHRAFLEKEDEVGAEYFDWHRFDFFLERATALCNTFAQFKLLLVKAMNEERASRGGKGGGKAQ